jgi:DNA-binding transcriptional LysR family regulator
MVFVAGAGAPLIYANRAYGVPQRFHQRGAGATPAESSAGTLALGCFQTFAPYVVPALVARLTKLHPGIALTLVEADQTQLLAGLRRGELDIALLYDFGLGEDFNVEPLAELTPYVLLPDGHPLAAVAAISLEALMQEPLILLDVEPSRDYFLSLFRDRDLAPFVAYRTASFEMVRGLVAHGLGYSLLATKPANNMSYDGRALVTRPLTSHVKNSPLVIAHLARRALSANAQAFAGHCRSFFPRLTPRSYRHAHTPA